MKYREMVKKVQHYSGFSDQESEKALRVVIRQLTERLKGGERKDFASQLPSELQEVASEAFDVETPSTNANQFIQQICEAQEIDESRAKKYVHSVWETLRDAITPGQVSQIKQQLPNDLAAIVH